VCADEAGGDFASLYAEWEFQHERNNADLAERLIRQYRSAWLSDDIENRFAALSVVFRLRLLDGFDLVRDGLKTEDRELAIHAATTACSLILHGYDLGPGIGEQLREFVMRYPDWEVVIHPALTKLEN
jgi:hypothetical protein